MKIVGLLGLPGAGKTTAMNSLEDRIDHNFVGFQMKNVAMNEFEKMQEEGLDAFPQELQSEIKSREIENEVIFDGPPAENIADWVDTILSINGDYFAQRAAHEIEEISADVVVVDGVRSTNDVRNIRSVSGEFYLVYLHTPFGERLKRLQDRGRDGEKDVDSQYLIERDNQELSWGVDEILSEYNKGYDNYEKEFNVEYFYSNYNSIGKFEAEFSFFIDKLLGL